MSRRMGITPLLCFGTIRYTFSCIVDSRHKGVTHAYSEG